MFFIEMYTSFLQKIERWKYCLLSPANRLKIRNVEREFVDRDTRMFHACFTLLCDFVEKEYGGQEEYQSQIDNSLNVEARKRNQILLDLYKWYNSIDWDDTVPQSPEYRAAIDSVNYNSFQITGNCTDLEAACHIGGKPEDIVRLGELRLEHSQKIAKFERIAEYNFLRLARYSKYMWC